MVLHFLVVMSDQKRCYVVLARDDERGFLIWLEFCFSDTAADSQKAIGIDGGI